MYQIGRALVYQVIAVESEVWWVMIGDRVRVLKEHKDGALDGQLVGINTPHAAAFKVLLHERILLSWKKKKNP